MVRLVGSCKSRELVVLSPVEVAAVNYNTAYACRVAVHIFCGRMGNYIRAELKRAAVYRGRESVVDYQRHAVGMSRSRILLNIEHNERGIRYSLGEHGFCVIFECRVELLLRRIGANEGEIDAELSHRDIEEIECSAVYRGCCNDMVACGADIENGEERRRLAGRGEHRADAALKVGYLRGYAVVCGILETGVEIARFLKVKEPAHLLARFVFICRALDYRHNARLAVFRSIAGLHALCFYIKAHFVLSFLSVFEKMTHKVEAGINKIAGLGC